MPSLKLFLFGQPRFERDGRTLKFDTRKNIALVAYLALTSKTHSRETLATLLWPESEPSRARAVLRRNLSVLRKTLGSEWLIVDGNDIGTDPDADFWLDVDQFSHLLSSCQAHNHPDTQICSQCLGILAKAAELYRGDLLEGFGLRDSTTFDEWQFFQTQGLRDKLAGALEQLVMGHSARGEFAPAIAYARRWLTLDPLREAAHRWLIKLYAWADQRTAALRQYEECERILQKELHVEPSRDTTVLYERIRDGIAQRHSLDRHRHNLPVQPTPFVGREALLTQIEERLRDPACRMLTLIGPGGSGKTRLALETAARQINRYSHGVFFVPLAPLRSVESILPTIARTLGFAFHGEGEPKEQLFKYLQNKSILLILDNYEHLSNGAGLVAEILAATSKVTILSTSRIRLNVRAESVYPVEGMDFPASEGKHPGDVQDAERYSAVKLFLNAAHRVWPDCELTNDSLTGIIRICRLVEGMPLGILLAASWVQVLSITGIADQIASRLPGHSLDFLQSELSDVPERHRSMRAVLDHSWALLTPREQDAMQRLSVFRGSFIHEPAHQVARVSLPELRALINKSLLHWQPSGRYHLHELVQQYAAEKLKQSPAALEETRNRHCAWYTAALQRWATDLKGPRQQEVLAEMDAEIENTRAARDWAEKHGLIPELTLSLDGLCAYYQRRGRFEEGQTACRSVVEKLQDTASAGEMLTSPPPARPEVWTDVPERQRLLAKALTWQGLFTRLTGYAGLAGPFLERSIALLDALESAGQDVRAERAVALLEMGRQAFDLDRVRAERCFAHSLNLYQTLDDRHGVADTLYWLGFMADGLGDYDRARQALNESLSIRQALGDQQNTANSLALLGLIALRVGQLDQGEALLRQSVALSREMGERVGLVDGLHYLGFAAFLQGKFEQGIVLQKECLALANDLALGHLRGMALQALGNYYAMLGQYEQAHAFATTGLAHARTLNDAYVIGATCIVLGLISLAQEKYVNSQKWFEQSLATYQGMEQWDSQSWSLTNLGYAAQGLGDFEQARQYLAEALQIGVGANSFLSIALALSGVALLMARTGDVETAIKLWALLSRYPLISNAPSFHDTAGRHIAAAASTLPPATIAAAKEQGLAGDLESAVTMALDMLHRP